MYVVFGATGNTGRVVAERLLDEGKEVRVVGRSAERLAPFVERGAEAAIGSMYDADFVQQTLDGASAAYTLLPTNFQADDFIHTQIELGKSLAKAIANSSVGHVVNLSSDAAHKSAGTGPILPLHHFENQLNAIEGLKVLHLRPTFFMENWLGNVSVIQQMGIHGSPISPDATFRVISVRDIGPVAAEHLLALDFEGSSFKILASPEEVNMHRVTQAIGTAIGKPELPYVQFPYADAEQAIIGSGVSASLAAAYIEMFQMINGEGLSDVEPVNRTATTVEQFAQTFAEIYQASEPATA